MSGPSDSYLSSSASYSSSSPLTGSGSSAKPDLPGYIDSALRAKANATNASSDENRTGSARNKRDGNSADPRTPPITNNSNHDDMLGRTVYFAKDAFKIKGCIPCQGEELFALECQRPISGYTGRCPKCSRQHVELDNARGYYVTVRSVYDALERDQLQKRRAQGPKPIEDLRSITYNLPPLDQPIFGENKGIEGDSNSCYMDATIFCMFAYSNTFDSLLHMETENPSTKTLQQLFRENIVNVLRSENGFVERDALYHLRSKLSDAAKDVSFLEMEKDPSEFLRALETLFHYAPLKTIPSNQPPNPTSSNITTNIIWEMFDANPQSLRSTKIASIFRNSLAEIQVKLATIPPFLILVAPRHTRSQRSYRYIIPDREIILDNNIVQLVCLKCQKTNHDADSSCDFFSCSECFSKDAHLSNSPPTTEAKVICYCRSCGTDMHKGLPDEERSYHNIRKIEISRHKLNLFAVLCIETSHYVAFVKCKRRDRQSEWLFFDSMSDRIHNEKNIARVDRVPKLEEWIAQAEKENYFFEDLDNLRSQARPSSQKFDENNARMLRLFRDGAFFFYENSMANYH